MVCDERVSALRPYMASSPSHAPIKPLPSRRLLCMPKYVLRGRYAQELKTCWHSQRENIPDLGPFALKCKFYGGNTFGRSKVHQAYAVEVISEEPNYPS